MLESLFLYLVPSQVQEELWMCIDYYVTWGDTVQFDWTLKFDYYF